MSDRVPAARLGDAAMEELSAKGSSGAQAKVFAEAKRVIAAFEAAGVEALLLGGAAVGITCERLGSEPPTRPIEDIDFLVPGGQQGPISEALIALDYVEDRETNLIQGDRRLIYYARSTSLKIDIFVGQFTMCHRIDVRSGLLGLADVTSLVLTKLQIVELTDKDVTDLLALFAVAEDGPGADQIDVERIAAMTSKDWCLYTTFTDGLATLEQASAGSARSAARGRIAQLAEAIEGADKTRGWKLRQRIGRRKRWYDLPEEVEAADAD